MHEYGANLTEIFRDIKEIITFELLYEKVLELNEEGRVYSTIDEDHWSRITG